MADFTSGIWSWYIGIVTIISIVVLIVFAFKLAGRKRKADEQAESVGHIWDEDLYELNNPLPRWWLYLYMGTMFWGIIYLVLYPGLGSFSGTKNWSQESQYEAEVALAEETYGPIYEQYLNQDLNNLVNNEDALQIGARLFSTYCTTCHGSDARGARGYPDLTDTEWLHGGDPSSIKTSIMEGRIGAMPAWLEILGTEGVFNVTEYMRTLAGHEANTTVALRGREIYAANCVICHGEDGKGNQALGAPDMTNDIWLYGGSQSRILESISYGRNGNMPPHKEFLGEAKAHLLAAYVYSLSN